MEQAIEREPADETEGKEVPGGPAATSAAPELNSSPIPTQEQAEEAGIGAVPEAHEAPEPEPETEPEPEPEAEAPKPEPEPEQADAGEQPGESGCPCGGGAAECCGASDLGKATRTFTQEEVNDMVGNTRVETRERTFRYIYDRYGVGSEAELDDLIGNAQRYDSLEERYSSESRDWKAKAAERDRELGEVREQVALLQSGIDRSRFDDAKLIIRGKGLEVTPESIQSELAAHPEWMGGQQQAKEGMPFAKNPSIAPNPAISGRSEPESRMTSVMGNEPDGDGAGRPMSEEDYALNRMFKV